MSAEYKLMATIKNNGEIERYIIKHKERNDFVKAISYDKLKLLVEKRKVEWLKLDNNGNVDIDKDEIDKALRPFKLAIFVNNKIKNLYEEAKKITLEQLTDMGVFDKSHIIDNYIASTVLGMYKSNNGVYMTFIMMYSKEGLVDTVLNKLEKSNGIIKLEPHPSKYLTLAVINAEVLLEIMQDSNIKLVINTNEMNKSLNLMNMALNILGMTRGNEVNDEITKVIISKFESLTKERIKVYETFV